MISILVACGAAILLLIGRQVMKEEPAVAPIRRTLVDVELEWKCPSGHVFRAGGQVEPRKCWTCNQPAYPLARFQCRTHGEVDVIARFEAAPDDGHAILSAFSTHGSDWTPASEPVLCPKCRQPMKRHVEDPLAKSRGRKP